MLGATPTKAQQAQDRWPYEGTPSSFVGLETPYLQTQNSFEGNIGSLQTTPQVSGGQSGRQTYYGGASYRGAGNWELGANLVIFDDEPGQRVSNTTESITYISSGVNLKYKFLETKAIDAAVKLSVDRVYYSRGGKITDQSGVSPSRKSTFIASTLEMPLGLRLSENLTGTTTLSWTDIQQSSATLETFSDRLAAEFGLIYRLSERVTTYGSTQQVWRMQSNAADATDGKKSTRIYTLGMQYALTPQAVINVFATNLFGPYGSARHLPFFPDDDAPTFGVLLKYSPSGRGVGPNAPRFHTLRYNCGECHTSPESGNLQSDTISVTATAGPKQSGAINLKYSIDPDIQFEFVAEQYHSGENSRFRSRNKEDLRVTVGGRWQALGEHYGHPFDLSFGVSAGRDLKDPSIGALVADARLSKSIGPYSISAQASGAIFADVYAQGFGIEATRTIAENFHANLGTKFTNNGDTIWTAGVTKTFENSPFSIGLEATNAMGTTGLGTLYQASKPHLKVSVMWVTALDLL
jgi:hypothetical protein